MEQKPLQKAERKTCGICSMTLEPPKGICECDYYRGITTCPYCKQMFENRCLSEKEALKVSKPFETRQYFLSLSVLKCPVCSKEAVLDQERPTHQSALLAGMGLGAVATASIVSILVSIFPFIEQYAVAPGVFLWLVSGMFLAFKFEDFINSLLERYTRKGKLSKGLILFYNGNPDKAAEIFSKISKDAVKSDSISRCASSYLSLCSQSLKEKKFF